MNIVSDKEKKKYSGSRRGKSLPMLISCSIIFLLIGMAIAETTVIQISGKHWFQNDDTLVLKNESLNVNIGQNETTIYRLHVNGTSYFVDVMIVDDIIMAYGGDSTDWNLAYTWGDHSIIGYLTGWNDGDPFYNNSDAFHVTYVLMDEWNQSYDWGDHSLVGYLMDWDDGDPFFNNSDAWHVTSVLMNEWNQSYDWGDHSLVGYLTDWNDGDPFYNNSDAYYVTSALMVEWNESYSWGDHSLMGYLTDWNDGDPFFNVSDAWHVTSVLMSEWNESYSWGDHSLMGYLTEGEQGLWNRSNNTLYTATNNDSVQINNSFSVTTIVNVSIEESEWWNTDWDYYKTITIESDYVDSSLSNFPILVSIDDATGDKCKANGEDIVFLSTVDSGVLNHEIEKWVDGSDRIVWVNITTISSDVDTVIYMYYGNSEAGDSQNPSGVWDGDFLGVFHLDETSGSVLDSTSNNNDGSFVGNLPTQISGQMGYGQDLDGDGDYVLLPSGCHSPLVATVEMWVSQDDGSATGYFYNRDPVGTITDFIVLYYDGSAFSFYNDGDWSIGGGTASSSMQYFSMGWTDGSQNFRINDASIGTDTVTPIPDFDYRAIRVGDSHVAGHGLDGKLDEIRISNIKRSDVWRDVSYHSQTQTEGFLTFGSEQEYVPESYYDKQVDLLKVNSTQVNITCALWLKYVPTDYDMSLYDGNIAINGTTGLLGTKLLDDSWNWR